MPKSSKNKPEAPKHAPSKTSTPAMAGAEATRGLTRREAAGLLGVSVGTVRRLEDRGRLHPSGAAGEERRFDAEEVRKLAAGRDGQQLARALTEGDEAATVFALLDEGATLRQVVKHARIVPDRVLRLHGEYVRLGSCEGAYVAVPRDELVRVWKVAQKLSEEGCTPAVVLDGATLTPESLVRGLQMLIEDSAQRTREMPGNAKQA